MNIPLLLLVLVITAALWFLYHKIFDVYYFDSVAGIAKELMVCFVLSFIVLAILKKLGKVILILFVIGVVVAVILALLGVFKTKNNSQDTDATPDSEQAYSNSDVNN